MKNLLLVLLLTACHPLPAVQAGETLVPDYISDEMNADAAMVCHAAGVGDSSTCEDLIYDTFVEALDSGSKHSEDLDYHEVFLLAMSMTGCNDSKLMAESKSCKVYVPLWASYYITGYNNKGLLYVPGQTCDQIHPDSIFKL